jgi:hypothetical protein
MAHVTTPRRRILIAVTAAWAVLLVVVAVYAARHGAPTVRGQKQRRRGAADPRPRHRATSPSPLRGDRSRRPVAEISVYQEVSRSCSITAVAPARATSGPSACTCRRARSRRCSTGSAPAARPVRRRDHPQPPRTAADAGNFVCSAARSAAPAKVTLNADTGAVRSPDRSPRSSRPSSAAPRPGGTVLATLRVSAAPWRTHRVDCPRGGSVWTVEADGPAGAPRRPW